MELNKKINFVFSIVSITDILYRILIYISKDMKEKYNNK